MAWCSSHSSTSNPIQIGLLRGVSGWAGLWLCRMGVVWVYVDVDQPQGSAGPTGLRRGAHTSIMIIIPNDWCTLALLICSSAFILLPTVILLLDYNTRQSAGEDDDHHFTPNDCCTLALLICSSDFILLTVILLLDYNTTDALGRTVLWSEH